MSDNIVLILFFSVIGLTWIEAMPTKGSEESSNMVFSAQKPEDMKCRENEHYNNTRLDCEDHCHDRNKKFCFGFEGFCWCNEGYIRDSSLNCVKIEDCLKDEEQNSLTSTSSVDNNSSKGLEDALKLFSNHPALHNSSETDSRLLQWNETIDQNILDAVFGKLLDLYAEVSNEEQESQVHQFNEIIDQKVLDSVFGRPRDLSAEVNNEEYESPSPETYEPLDENILISNRGSLEEPPAEDWINME